MDDVERRLSGALKARADEVTDDSLSDLDLGIRTVTPRRRWPVVAAVAGVAAALVVSLALIPGVFRSVPPEITSPAVPCDSACHVIQRLTVDGDSLEVWVGAQPDAWEVRVRGVPVAGLRKNGGNIVSKDPLTCWTEPAPARCVVRTTGAGVYTTWSSLIKEPGVGWHVSGVMFTPDTVESVRVVELDMPHDSGLLFVERGGPANRWTAEVWTWTGLRLGCIGYVDTKEELPGWPEVRPRQADVFTDC